MLRIWGRRSSFNVQKVLWLAGELGLDFERVPAGGAEGRLDDPQFRALNPHGKVPVLEDGDLAIWESHAILRYLAARFGGSDFWSEDPAARSQADRWIDWAATTLQPDFLNGVFWAFYRTPEPQRDWLAINDKVACSARHFGQLERQLEGRDYLLGGALSLADIPAGTALYRYYELEIERPPLPRVEAWYARLQERPAYREAVMVPFDELKGRLSF